MRFRNGLWLSLLLVGCGGGAGHHGSDGGGVSADLASPPLTFDIGVVAADLSAAAVPDMAAACSDLTLDGTTTVTLPYVASDIPSFSGGSIVDGSYALTGGAVYTGAGGMTGNFPGTFQARYRFAGSHVDFLAVTPGGTASDSATFVVSGSSLTITPSCPSDAPVISGPYTATSSGITLGMASGTMGSTLVFTKE